MTVTTEQTRHDAVAESIGVALAAQKLATHALAKGQHAPVAPAPAADQRTGTDLFCSRVITSPLRRKAGSPRVYDRLAVVEAVCRRIEAGELVDEAATSEGTDRRRIWEWTRSDSELSDVYARAREASAESLEMEAIRVARASTAETCSRDRLLIDTLKWAAAKRRPRVYGSRADLDSGEPQALGVVFLPEKRP